jgi:arsenate reductase
MNMNNFIIYHNPKCSKSRQTLQLLKDKGCEPKIFLYLEEKLSSSMIEEILLKLSMEPRELLRKTEEHYKSNGLFNDSLTRQEIIGAMVKFPKLIERPIVIKDNRAIIGRPPENVLELM